MSNTNLSIPKKEEKSITDLKLSELVEQSLNKGVVPIVHFVDLEPKLDKAYNLGVQACIETLFNTPFESIDQAPTFKQTLYEKLNQLKKP